MNIELQIVYSVLLLLCATISYSTADETKKKLKLVLDKLDKVKDAEVILKTDITFDKVGDEEVKVNGQIKQSVDLDDEYKINADVLHSTDKEGDYQKMAGIENLGVCNFMANRYKKYLYETLKNYANAPDPDTCPVKQDTYTVKDYPLDCSKFQKFLRPGFYKIISSLMHKEEEVLQYIVEAHTEEE